MDTEAGRVKIGDKTSRGIVAINQLHWDGLGVGEGLQMILKQDGGVHKRITGGRID